MVFPAAAAGEKLRWRVEEGEGVERGGNATSVASLWKD